MLDQLKQELETLNEKQREIEEEKTVAMKRRADARDKIIRHIGQADPKHQEELTASVAQVDSFHGLAVEMDERRDALRQQIAAIEREQIQEEKLQQLYAVAAAIEADAAQIDELARLALKTLNITAPRAAASFVAIQAHQIEFQRLARALGGELPLDLAAVPELQGEKITLRIQDLRKESNGSEEYGAFFLQALDLAIQRVFIKNRTAAVPQNGA